MTGVEKTLGYKFRNPLLLAEALTHPSLAYESRRPHFDNQRLEFLGDAVLQLVLTEELFRMFPEFPEGRLTKLRARLVSRRALAGFAGDLELGEFVMLGKGEETSGGRKRLSTLADAFEALVGAVYLDGGPLSARQVVLRVCGGAVQELTESPEERNPKGELQECLQAISATAPCYKIVSESGPDHRKVFQAEVIWRGLHLGIGRGKSKKDAEARAASDALRNRVWQEASPPAAEIAGRD
jgi:ribonuclease-3